MKQVFRQLLPSRQSFGHDLACTCLFFAIATAVSFTLFTITGHTNNASEIYILSVFFVAIRTAGYFWGLISALCGVLGANCFFTYPFNALDFTLEDYPVTFLCMLLVAVITTTLASGLKQQMQQVRKREAGTQMLNEISHTLLGAQSAGEIGRCAADNLSRLLGQPVQFYLSPETVFCAGEGTVPAPDAGAISCIFAGKSVKNTDLIYIPFRNAEKTLAAAVTVRSPDEDMPDDASEFFQLLSSAFCMALTRQYTEDERQQVLIEKRAEQMRSNLLRAISHDLRTPLTAIMGASAALEENKDRISPETWSSLLHDINADADWLLRMVENLLSVTKIGEKGINLHCLPEPVEEVVAQAVSKCRKRFPNIQLKIQVPDEFLMAPMDATLIEQVLLNLTENAIRHGASSQPVELSVEKEGEQAVFTVRDHGKGLSDDALAHLFTGFAARDRSDNDSSRGLGLGLTICQSIIAAHGGTIEGKNAPDGGAIFRFTLPTEDDIYAK